MTKPSYYYFLEVQYLGYRYHGWQKQPGLKTVQGMIEKTLGYVLGHEEFKTLGSSRTDARVSARQSAFELFLREPINIEGLLKGFELNLPADINVLSCKQVDSHFNIIQHPSIKEYHYNFSFGPKNHPFSAPLIVRFSDDIDIENMMEGARIFQGTHNFHKYCCKPSAGTVFEREILESVIERKVNHEIEYGPREYFVYKVKGYGFMRYQVRLMMAALLELGRGDISMNDLLNSLEDKGQSLQTNIVPASGLVLNKIDFIDIEKHYWRQ